MDLPVDYVIVVPAPTTKTQTRWNVTNDVDLKHHKTLIRKRLQHLENIFRKFQTDLFSFILTGLEDLDQPLQLVGGVSGVHHQPEVLPRTEIHVERDHPQTRLNLRRVKPPVSEIPQDDHRVTSQQLSHFMFALKKDVF